MQLDPDDCEQKLEQGQERTRVGNTQQTTCWTLTTHGTCFVRCSSPALIDGVCIAPLSVDRTCIMANSMISRVRGRDMRRAARDLISSLAPRAVFLSERVCRCC